MSDPTPAEALKAGELDPNCPAHRIIKTEVVGYEIKNGRKAPIHKLVEPLVLGAPPICTCENPTPDAGEVRTYREGVEDSAVLVESFPTEILHFWERPGGPPGNGYAPTTHADLAAAIRKLP